MVEKASDTDATTRGRPSKRGRPPTFDDDAVVDAAVSAFFEKGYDGTTLADLEAATGADRSTLYNSFGGKQGLYHRATARYLDRAADGLFGPLHDESVDGTAAVAAMFERVRLGLTSVDVSPGCLIVNDMAAGSDPAAAQRYRSLLEDGLSAALHRAAGAGDIDAATIEARVSLLSTTLIGINLISKHTGSPVEVDRLVDATVAEIARWSTSGASMR